MPETRIQAAQPMIGDDERRAVDRVLQSGILAQGPEVAAFEQEFAEHFTPGRPVVAVNSGTSGQHLGLLASGIGPGDEIIVPSFTFAAVANSVALTGATPVFADISPDTFLLDPDRVREAITIRTRGIMPVHLYGQAFNADAFKGIAEQWGMLLFEDAAQAHGATWRQQPVGTFGHFGMFSLYPTKNMTAVEGGMVSCATPELERGMRLLRNQGMERRYDNELIGFNARMSDVHAAIGRVQLQKVDAWTRMRQNNAAVYNRELSLIPGLKTPTVHPDATHVYHQYTIRVPAAERDRLRSALLNEHHIETGVYYPIPNHRLPALAPFARSIDLPETDRAAAEVLSLPVHPAVDAPALDRVITALARAMRAGA